MSTRRPADGGDEPPEPAPGAPSEERIVAAAGLTPRQASVYELRREGLGPEEIARRLDLSSTVVRDCLAQVRRKLALARRRVREEG